MITADTSVLVTAFGTWHVGHDRAKLAIRDVQSLTSHVLLETYAVLTRLPEPHASPGTIVAEYLRRRFPNEALILPPRLLQELPGLVADLGLTGAAIYDAAIASTALHAGATLLSRDHRATRVYEAVGVTYKLL